MQKYERGANRISASKLFVIAKALNWPVASFFPDQDAEVAEHGPDAATTMVGMRGGLAAAELWLELSEHHRDALERIMRTLSETITKVAA